MLLFLDGLAITFFLWAPFQERTPLFLGVDYLIAAFIAVDYAMRAWIAKKKARFFLNPLNIADVIVLFTLLAPFFIHNAGFLRILRAIRLMRAFTFLRHIKGVSSYLRENSEIIDRVVDLVVFILIMTAIVFVSQVQVNDTINNYMDALYFTVASLTTTGYGDIVVEGVIGKWIAIIIMVLGISLFLQLLRTLFYPQKVSVECKSCGLSNHDPDAVHCKHCGEIINIPTKGFDG